MNPNTEIEPPVRRLVRRSLLGLRSLGEVGGVGGSLAEVDPWLKFPFSKTKALLATYQNSRPSRIGTSSNAHPAHLLRPVLCR
jgi:hypothetical protein